MRRNDRDDNTSGSTKLSLRSLTGMCVRWLSPCHLRGVWGILCFRKTKWVLGNEHLVDQCIPKEEQRICDRWRAVSRRLEK